MLPFDDIHPMYGRGLSVSYGVDDGAAEGAEGANGEGGDDSVAQAQAAAGVLQGVAMVSAVAFQGISGIMVTANTVFFKVSDSQKQFNQRSEKLNVLNRKTREYRHWLRNPGNRAQWQNGPASRRAVPANRKLCPPIYEGTVLTHIQTSHALSCGSHGRQSDCTTGCNKGHAAPRNWHKIPGTSLRPNYNPGGHKCGDAGCQCPTHECAFKDSAKALRYKKWLKKGPYEGWPGFWKSNPPEEKGWGVERIRDYCQNTWSYLMTVAPAERLHNLINPSTPFAVEYTTLVSPDVLSVVWPDEDGQIPLPMQIHWWNTIKEIHNLGLPVWGNDQEVPFFVFGFTEEEIREQMPDGLIRAAIFSVKALLTIQRMYTVKYLAAQGVPGFAGVSYGQDTAAEGVSTDTMKELIFGSYREIAGGANPLHAADTVTTRLSPNRLANAKLNRGRLRETTPVTPDDPPVVNPNYVPLAAGGVALATSLFLRFSR